MRYLAIMIFFLWNIPAYSEDLRGNLIAGTWEIIDYKGESGAIDAKNFLGTLQTFEVGNMKGPFFKCDRATQQISSYMKSSDYEIQ